MMQKSIIKPIGNDEYLAHDFVGNLIATIKYVGEYFEIYHYSGKRHGKITKAKQMPDVVSSLVEEFTTNHKHLGSFFSEEYGPNERFAHDGQTYTLILTGAMAGQYFCAK
jgi:hypothetical protein